MKEDVTLEVQELINLFQKSNILDEKQLRTEDLIQVVEKYYSKGNRLSDKLNDAKFNAHI